MTASTSAKDQTIASLFAIFRDQGFGGATLSVLSRGTGLGRSSLYHHFPGGKEDMASAVLDRADAVLTDLVDTGGTGSPRERLDRMLAVLDRLYAGGKNGCVLATFTQGEARTLFQRRLIALFGIWVDGFAALAEETGAAPRIARERAEDAVAALEGALILSAGLNDPAPFRRALARLPGLLLGGG